MKCSSRYKMTTWKFTLVKSPVNRGFDQIEILGSHCFNWPIKMRLSHFTFQNCNWSISTRRANDFEPWFWTQGLTRVFRANWTRSTEESSNAPPEPSATRDYCHFGEVKNCKINSVENNILKIIGNGCRLSLHLNGNLNVGKTILVNSDYDIGIWNWRDFRWKFLTMTVLKILGSHKPIKILEYAIR